jgi:hypothetical protein
MGGQLVTLLMEGRSFVECMKQGKSFNGLKPMSVELGVAVAKGFW